MSVSMLCGQCGSPAERCEHCAGALCLRLLCAELHEASCAAVSAMPSATPLEEPVLAARPAPRTRTERDQDAERQRVEHLVLAIPRHRHKGRAALVSGELDTAFDELWRARDLEPGL